MGLKIHGGKPPEKPNPYDAVFNTAPAIGSVSVAKGKQEKILQDSSEVVHPGIAIPKEQMCVVGVSASHTINIGNYESVKVSASLSMPCHKHEIDATYDFASEWVSGKITEAAKGFKD